VGATVHDEPWPLFYSFLIIQTVGRAPWVGESAHRKATTYTGQHTHRKNAVNIHASSGIQTHNPSLNGQRKFTWAEGQSTAPYMSNILQIMDNAVSAAHIDNNH
jgi:hypothetical protein